MKIVPSEDDQPTQAAAEPGDQQHDLAEAFVRHGKGAEPHEGEAVAGEADDGLEEFKERQHGPFTPASMAAETSLGSSTGSAVRAETGRWPARARSGPRDRAQHPVPYGDAAAQQGPVERQAGQAVVVQQEARTSCERASWCTGRARSPG